MSSLRMVLVRVKVPDERFFALSRLWTRTRDRYMTQRIIAFNGQRLEHFEVHFAANLLLKSSSGKEVDSKFAPEV